MSNENNENNDKWEPLAIQYTAGNSKFTVDVCWETRCYRVNAESFETEPTGPVDTRTVAIVDNSTEDYTDPLAGYSARKEGDSLNHLTEKPEDEHRQLRRMYEGLEASLECEKERGDSLGRALGEKNLQVHYLTEQLTALQASSVIQVRELKAKTASIVTLQLVAQGEKGRTYEMAQQIYEGREKIESLELARVAIAKGADLLGAGLEKERARSAHLVKELDLACKAREEAETASSTKEDGGSADDKKLIEELTGALAKEKYDLVETNKTVNNLREESIRLNGRLDVAAQQFSDERNRAVLHEAKAKEFDEERTQRLKLSAYIREQAAEMRKETERASNEAFEAGVSKSRLSEAEAEIERLNGRLKAIVGDFDPKSVIED